MVIPKCLQFFQTDNQFRLFRTFLFSLVGCTSAIFLSTAQIQANFSDRLADGVYLYGESTQPNEIGKEYIVFETHHGKTIGAFYLPQSEFSCFYGQFRGGELKVNLIDTYDRQMYRYALSLNSKGLTASKQPMMGSPTYQPIDKLSNNDRQILNACKMELQNSR